MPCAQRHFFNKRAFLGDEINIELHTRYKIYDNVAPNPDNMIWDLVFDIVSYVWSYHVCLVVGALSERQIKKYNILVGAPLCSNFNAIHCPMKLDRRIARWVFSSFISLCSILYTFDL